MSRGAPTDILEFASAHSIQVASKSCKDGDMLSEFASAHSIQVASAKIHSAAANEL